MLSKDAFGCHVVQKAFDNVSDELKGGYVSELLTEIRETVTHRQACHVWQKLFEVRWIGKAPELMSFVNRELLGQWDEVAMGETGSLVVQNIFENCVESEKRPCTEEVMANLTKIVRGQWGNWVIQHVRISPSLLEILTNESDCRIWRSTGSRARIENCYGECHRVLGRSVCLESH